MEYTSTIKEFIKNILIAPEESDILRQKIELISSPKILDVFERFFDEDSSSIFKLKIGMFRYDKYICCYT